MNSEFRINQNIFNDSEEEYEIDLDNINKKLSFTINDNLGDWYKYHLVFPHDDDDYYYDLYYENQNGIYERKDNYLILKIDNNNRFVKEVHQDEYDLYKWSENEYPFVYQEPYYIE